MITIMVIIKEMMMIMVGLMIEILTNSIIPVFAVMALGFLLGRINFVSNAEAVTLNRVAFFILQPALIFPLIANANFNEFYVGAVALYAIAQAIVFLISFFIGFFLFSCSFIESWLVAMATIFVNSLLCVAVCLCVFLMFQFCRFLLRGEGSNKKHEHTVNGKQPE